MPVAKSVTRCNLAKWFDARFGVALSREKATEHRDEPYHFVQSRRFVGWLILVENEGALPFIGLKQQSGFNR